MKLDFLWSRAKVFHRELTLMSGITLLSSLATLSVPWLAGQLLGGLLGPTSGGLYAIAGLLALALVAMTALNIAGGLVSAKVSGQILARLRTDAYDHIQMLSMGFHDQSQRGDLLALMTYEVRNLSDFLTSTIANIPALLLTAGGATILLLLIDPAMALVIPVLIPLFYIVMKLVGRRLRNLASQVRESEAEVMWVADSDLEMLPAIKSFAAEGQHREVYSRKVEKARAFALREDRITAMIGPGIALICAISAIAIIVFSSQQTPSSERAPGELFAFLLYAALLTRPVGSLANIYGQLQIARGTTARLESVLSAPPEPGYSGLKEIDRAAGEIAFQGVTFSYQDREVILHAISLTISAGEIVALTGDNGAGKTTLIRLLLRYYDPQEGRVLIDDTDIADLQVQSLRRQFGYVPQRALLFNGTIAQNIAFGREHATAQEIERAARIAQGWDFISDLPQGLQTEIGDNGVRLSGGQRQRIALARALVSDPPVLILDEATSMYDLDGETAFITECKAALKNRTVILITHRPASLDLASRIFEVREGKVLEIETG